MNAQDKAEALQWIARILHLTRPTIELDNLRALIERQTDTDGERWRTVRQLICSSDIEKGLRSFKAFGGLAHEIVNQEVDAAVDAAMAAMKEKA